MEKAEEECYKDRFFLVPDGCYDDDWIKEVCVYNRDMEEVMDNKFQNNGERNENNQGKSF